MLDTNLCNRDKILPVEKSYAYKMKMEILKNNPNISNINEFMDNSTEWNSNQKSQIYNYIKLTLVQAQKIRLKKNNITY